jgi:hypothetical protein
MNTLTASRILGDQVGSAAPVFLAVLAVHVVAGLTAVICGPIAALARKGTPRHIRAGRWYYRAIAAVFATAAALAAMRWRQDYYLFIIGAISFTAATIGYQHRRRHRPGDAGHIAGMGIAYVAMLTPSTSTTARTCRCGTACPPWPSGCCPPPSECSSSPAPLRAPAALTDLPARRGNTTTETGAKNLDVPHPEVAGHKTRWRRGAEGGQARGNGWPANLLALDAQVVRCWAPGEDQHGSPPAGRASPLALGLAHGGGRRGDRLAGRMHLRGFGTWPTRDRLQRQGHIAHDDLDLAVAVQP